MFSRNMQVSTRLEAIRIEVIQKLCQILEGNVPKENLIELARTLDNTPEVHTNTYLLQSFTLLDFLSKQLTNGNEDIVSPQIIQESCTYMLDKLTPGTQYIP